MFLKFSVLLPIYIKEKPEYLIKALESITDKQLLKPNEIVIVKDGPLTEDLDDVIYEYVKKYPKLFKIVALETNVGLGRALNIGLDNCTYELVARMDADDISKPERFLEQVNIFKKNSNISIVGSWIDEFNESDGRIFSDTIRKVPEKTEQILKMLKHTCCFNHPTVMYKKSKIKEVGSYNQDFLLEDYYLWIRLAMSNASMYNIQKSLLLFRIDENSIKRRGGFKLFKSDIRFQIHLYKIKFINLYECMLNMMLYGTYRIVPNKIRKIMQKKIRDKKVII